MKRTILFAMALWTLSFASAAQAGKELGNGGSTDALGFYPIATMVVADISNQRADYPEVTTSLLNQLIDSAQIIISEDALYVDGQGIRQPVVAINYKNPLRIVLHRSSWLALEENEKKALVFHELLGLAGLESTGDYHISYRYYISNKISLYDCKISTDGVALKFTLKDSPKDFSRVSIEKMENSNIVDRTLITMGRSIITGDGKNGTDSSFVRINFLKKDQEQWVSTKEDTFFGSPRLPDIFRLGLTSSSLTDRAYLHCSIKK